MANPSLTGFTNSLANEFRAGLADEDVTHETINLFQEGYVGQDHIGCLEADYKSLILGADGLAFIFPWWWEMPPYPMTAFLQRIFVNGFAYKHDGVKTPILDKPVQLIISMGQNKPINLQNLCDGMEYCGLHVRHWMAAQGVNPSMDEAKALQYKNEAYNAGRNFGIALQQLK